MENELFTSVTELYINRGSPTYKVAKELNLSLSSVRRALRENNLLRTHSEANILAYATGRMPSKKLPLDNNLILKMYKDEKLSTTQIAGKLNCSHRAIRERLEEMGCPRRSLKEAFRIKFPLGVHYKGERWVDNRGYIRITKRGKGGGCIFEHQEVWEKTHNRKLPKDWVIHHLNGIKDDNRPCNLVALPTNKHINYIPTLKKRIRELEIENCQLKRALENGQFILHFNEN